jgi:hypothetical protein
MVFAAALNMGVPHCSAGQPQRTACHRHFAKVERLAGAAGSAANHHCANLRRAQQIMRHKAGKKRGQPRGCCPGQKAHPDLPVGW